MSRGTDIVQELTAISVIGDGVVAGLFARRHLALWDLPGWPEWYRDTVHALQERPWIIRGIAAAEVALGVWWAYRLVRRYPPASVADVPEREWALGRT